MDRILKCILILHIVLVGAPSSACTVFYASQGEAALAGNNEDWMNPLTKVWFEPMEKRKYGRVLSGSSF